MNRSVRALLLVVLVVTAGCTTLGVDGGETPTADTGGTATPTDSGAGSTATPAQSTPTGPVATATPVDVEFSETVEATVTRVIDGDTVEVRLPDGSEDTVRLVGIDTPEVHVENQPAEYEGVPESEDGAVCLRRAGHNATEFTVARVEGESVTLAFDPRSDRRGGYDRLLAYVYVDDRNLNHDLVATGHARVYDTEFVLRDAFETSETAARASSRGLWRCSEA